MARTHSRDGAIVAEDNFSVPRQRSEVGEPQAMRAHSPRGARVDEPAILKIALAQLSFSFVNMFDVVVHSGAHHVGTNGVVRARICAGIGVGSDNLSGVSGLAGWWLGGRAP